MAIKHYESVVIINAALEEEQIEKTIDLVLESVKTNGGEITDVEKWGRRRLAYPINKSKSGYYLIVRFTAPADLISKLERVYRLDENIVRYLTVTLDAEALKYLAKQKEKKAEEPENTEDDKPKEVEKTATEKVVEEKTTEVEDKEEESSDED